MESQLEPHSTILIVEGLPARISYINILTFSGNLKKKHFKICVSGMVWPRFLTNRDTLYLCSCQYDLYTRTCLQESRFHFGGLQQESVKLLRQVHGWKSSIIIRGKFIIFSYLNITIIIECYRSSIILSLHM